MSLIAEHKEAPHTRVLQKSLGEEVTVLVHGKEEYEKAIAASNILFGKSTASDLKSLDEQTFLDVFDGVPQATVSLTQVGNGLDMIAALAAETSFLKSNGEARRALKENAISVNKEKIKEDFLITSNDLIADKYVLLQRGKKNYYLLIVE
jgi:tyrosyl-tRNA synthetase